ncbi:hypothetical protein ACSD7O_20180 [Methylorubrum extorquens]|uniref:hypothetical protein n=1 Tax=Methylorubrum extorquens TaxID=408 RepID=UPI003F61DA85
MRSDDGADTAWLAVVTVEERSGSFDRGVGAGEELAVRDLAANWLQSISIGFSHGL